MKHLAEWINHIHGLSHDWGEGAKGGRSYGDHSMGQALGGVVLTQSDHVTNGWPGDLAVN